jgi:hypothetical protein
MGSTCPFILSKMAKLYIHASLIMASYTEDVHSRSAGVFQLNNYRSIRIRKFACYIETISPRKVISGFTLSGAFLFSVS